jgi:hypothetical protein
MIGQPPTRDEVMTVLTEDGHVLSLGNIIDRVWWARGGVGHHRDSPRVREQRTRVPVPTPAVIKQLLNELVAEGVVATAVGDDANKIGSVWGHTSWNGVYYTLAALATQSTALHEKLALACARAQHAVPRLRELAGDRVTDIDTTDGSILIRVTVEQGYALLGANPPSDDADTPPPAPTTHDPHTAKDSC